MVTLELTTEIRASPELCFDLSRDLDLHKWSAAESDEEAIAGRTHGLIEFGEEVTWRARHFGVYHEHTSRIAAFDRPRHFRDEMVRGRFARFVHDHYFEPTNHGTRMRDLVEFASPFPPVGVLVDYLFLRSYLKRFLETRNAKIREVAEAGGIRPYSDSR